MPRWTRLPIAAGLLLAGSTASAATFCVGTIAELRSALPSAQAAGDDEIRIRAGTYPVDATLVYNSTQPGWLVVGGGFADAGGVPCNARSTNAGATVLDGQGQRQIMILAHQPPAGTTSGMRMYIENLTFADGVGSGVQRGGGLNAFLLPDSAINELWLENLVFRNNSGYFAGGLQASVANGMIRVVNSLFDANNAPDSVFAHAALGLSASPAAYGSGIVVANSTFARGRCLGKRRAADPRRLSAAQWLRHRRRPAQSPRRDRCRRDRGAEPGSGVPRRFRALAALTSATIGVNRRAQPAAAVARGRGSACRQGHHDRSRPDHEPFRIRSPRRPIVLAVSTAGFAGTIGQVDTDPLRPATGGAFAVSGGLWPGVAPAAPRPHPVFASGFEPATP